MWERIIDKLPHTPQTGDLAYNPGMCPNGESNLWTFGLQAGTQSIELHQPGPNILHFRVSLFRLAYCKVEIS